MGSANPRPHCTAPSQRRQFNVDPFMRPPHDSVASSRPPASARFVASRSARQPTRWVEAGNLDASARDTFRGSRSRRGCTGLPDLPVRCGRDMARRSVVLSRIHAVVLLLSAGAGSCVGAPPFFSSGTIDFDDANIVESRRRMASPWPSRGFRRPLPTTALDDAGDLLLPEHADTADHANDGNDDEEDDDGGDDLGRHRVALHRHRDVHGGQRRRRRRRQRRRRWKAPRAAAGAAGVEGSRTRRRRPPSSSRRGRRPRSRSAAPAPFPAARARPCAHDARGAVGAAVHRQLVGRERRLVERAERRRTSAPPRCR